MSERKEQPFDIVERPLHYNAHRSGREAIDLTELLNANLSNALKYVWRRKDKGSELENLKKARWYGKRHCESEIHVPIFATQWLLDRFTQIAIEVIRCEDQDKLLLGVLSALTDGEPKRALDCIEEELKRLEANGKPGES